MLIFFIVGLLFSCFCCGHSRELLSRVVFLMGEDEDPLWISIYSNSHLWWHQKLRIIIIDLIIILPINQPLIFEMYESSIAATAEYSSSLYII